MGVSLAEKDAKDIHAEVSLTEAINREVCITKYNVSAMHGRCH